MIIMTAKLDRDMCMNCKRCINACPKGAIDVTTFGFLINPKLCDNCGKCVEICPSGAIKVE